MRRTCDLVAIDSDHTLVQTPPPAGFDVRAVTASDVDRVRDFRDEAVALEFRRFLAQGDLGVYAWHEGRVVGHVWALLCRRQRCVAWGGVETKAGEALLAWGNIREDLRGRGIFKSMIPALSRDVFATGRVRRILGDIAPDSPASMQVHLRAGFRVLGRLSYANFCGVVVGRRFTPKP